MDEKDLTRRLARRALGLSPSPIRELFPFMSIDGMISMGGGYPSPDTFALDSVSISIDGGETIRLDGAALDAATQYGPSDAHSALSPLLKEWHLAKDGVSLENDEFVTLNGSQEGLFIAAFLLLERDDSVVVSEPPYPGALSAFRAFCNNFVSVPLDGEGMDTAALAATLDKIASSGGKMPKLIYTIPSGHNPGGVTLSAKRREELVAIARRHDLLVLEDDPYQLVRLDDGAQPPTLQSLDEDRRVIRLDSFSKIFAPGLRIGYASGASAVMRRFVLFKQASNLHTSSFVQVVLARFLDTMRPAGFFRLIEKNCDFYRRNRDALIEAARELLPEGIAYHKPQNGMFVWFRMPVACDAAEMVRNDVNDLKVLLVPGPGFSTRGGLKNCMRASYATISPDAIREGVSRFAEMIRREYGRRKI